MTQTITLKNLRPRLPQVVETIDEKYSRFVVTKRGKPVVVMMSIDDYESLVETLDILSDKAGIARIKKGSSEVKTGQTVELSKLRRKIEKK